MRRISIIMLIGALLLVVTATALFAQTAVTPAPTPIIKNVALDKKAVANSCYDPHLYGPENVVDGRNNTVWGSLPGKTAYIYIDLGKAYMINRATLRWYSPFYPKRYHIGISMDQKNWSFVYTNNNCKGGDEELQSSAFVTTRYLGIYMEDFNSAACGLRELEVYGYDPDPVVTDELYITTKITNDTETAYTTELTMRNPNTSYTWNGTCFAVDTIRFKTSSQIVSITNPNVAVNYTQNGDTVTLDLGYRSLFDLNQELVLTMKAEKAGKMVYPMDFTPDYVRSKDIEYPVYGDLPDRWSPGKVKPVTADYITDPEYYYQQNLGPVSDTLIVYDPVHTSQVVISEPLKVTNMGGIYQDLRIKVVRKYMAMGMAFVYEWFKINPNYLSTITTKENFGTGITQDPTVTGYEMIIDGESWTWPFIVHPDGPFQTDPGTFTMLNVHYPDYFPADAVSSDFITTEFDAANPNWISSAITAGLHFTHIREYYAAVPDYAYMDFVKQANDPWAEFVLITHAYSRGTAGSNIEQLLTTDRAQALQSDDLIRDYYLSGCFPPGLPELKTLLTEINNEATHIYDAPISWSEMLTFTRKLKTFYGNGVPSEAEWEALERDLRNAFTVLADHWDGKSISFRYDFITMLRIIKKYLPEPHIARPTSEDWYYSVQNAPL